ncbi:MAG: YabP/YqfC family sporulation protein [Bacilli bacterium]|nr:YabP/YqfC family sporulation protein [Bacilli bacterium]
MKLIKIIDNYVNDRKFSMIFKNDKLNIINYSEIVDFSSFLITIRYEDRIYHIEGKDLVISKMMEEEILITGNISLITFS